MSEFSESYHILGNDRNEAIQLLKRSGLRGFVFPELNGWVSLVASGPKFRPNKRLIKYNILYPNDYDDFSKAGPAYDFCEIIGLQNIEWLSYKYVSEEWDPGNKSAYPNAIMVKPWYLFF